MRRIIFISFFTLISIVGYGQWLSESNNIYFNSGNVGIGTNNPTVKLNISDNTESNRIFLKLENKSLSNTSSVNVRLLAGNNGSFTSLSHLSETYTGSPNQADFGQLWTNGAGLLLRANGGILRFETSEEGATYERMRIDVNGNVGINTTQPRERLEVNGNILIKENYALILTSPNGTEFNITVDDNGNLVTSRLASTKPKTVDINISIYPNPTKNNLTIHVNDNTIQKIEVEIYDLSGKMIFLRNYTSNSFQINTIDLMTGTYILKLKDQYGNLIKTEKIIKQ